MSKNTTGFCINGHARTAENLNAQNRCKICKEESRKRYADKNRDKLNSQRREYSKKIKDRVSVARVSDAPCETCEKPFYRTSEEIKRGRRFCSVNCYLLGRQNDFEKKKLGRKCTSDGCERTDIVGRGLCNRCYQVWRLKFGQGVKWETVTCPTCGIDFPTYSNRKFCTTECYIKSDQFITARQKYSDDMAKARQLVQCLECGIDISVTKSGAASRSFTYNDNRKRMVRRNLFCGKTCRSKWFANRFDREVAEYTLLEIPMSYDEFLSQVELPCLIDGCGWIGRNLSTHCNRVHGVTAQELKALAGFNRQTGVIGSDTYDLMSNRKNGRQAGSSDIASHIDLEAISQPRGPMRPEGRERIRKSAALRKR